MNVIRAKTAGFCMGVSLALHKLNRAVEDGMRPLFTLGPIIHNPQVLKKYEDLGVHQISSPDEAPPNSCVVIRAHGIPRSLEQALVDRDVNIIDATCPKVKKAQLLIAEQADKGKRLLLYGEEDHPEVKGLLSYARDDALVFGSLEQIKSLSLAKNKPCFVAAQTTQDKVAFEEIVAYLQGLMGDLPVLNTICDATKERQTEAVAVAKQVRAMVVAGGFQSGNTRRLVNVVRDQGVHCVHVETRDQLPFEELKGFKSIGLTAGASTPNMIIDSIQQALESA